MKIFLNQKFKIKATISIFFCIVVLFTTYFLLLSLYINNFKSSLERKHKKRNFVSRFYFFVLNFNLVYGKKKSSKGTNKK